MLSDIGFVDEGMIPCPDGRRMSAGMIAAEHEAINQRYRATAISAAAASRGLDISAAADFMGPGAIEVPRYESEILDMVRRRGALGQRIKAQPATGQPARYFEQRTIVSGAFTDPRTITQTAGSPQRAERAITLKAISGQVNFGIFDVEVTRQQGMFSQLVAKDVMDMVTGVLRTSDIALWRGTDTDLATPTQNQYVGGQTQINRTFSVASNASIVDAIKAEVASIVSNESFEAKPTAIYAHPQTAELIEQEERLNHRQMSQVDVTNSDNQVIAGLRVSAISTAAGLLPIIPDWTMPIPVTPGTEGAGSTDYYLAIVSEDLIERHYLTAPEPRVFVLGLQGNLATQYVAILFDAVVFKGKATAATPEGTAVTYAHSFGTVTR